MDEMTKTVAATRQQMNDFRKRIREEFGYIVKIRTVSFMDLARCSKTFAVIVDLVIGNIHDIKLNDILQARVLSREYNIILEFPVIIKGD
jgi:hypothetical protein